MKPLHVFPYYGGKSKIAPEVWRRFGEPAAYCEPFAGSLAVLLARPEFRCRAVVNDLSGEVVNFWRAVQADPEGVARHAARPLFSAELRAARWAINPGTRAELQERVEADLDYFEVRRAGVFWYVQSASIQSGLHNEGPWIVEDGRMVKADRARGIDGARPGWSQRGAVRGVGGGRPNARPCGVPITGVEGSRVCVVGKSSRGPCRGAADGGQLERAIAAARDAAARIGRTSVLCGDWLAAIKYARLAADKRPVVGVFLDPPYPLSSGRDEHCYMNEHQSDEAARASFEWALEQGDDPRYRIAYCGYEGTFDFPGSWSRLAWKTQGGMGNLRKSGENVNGRRERVWFSPHCVPLGGWEGRDVIGVEAGGAYYETAGRRVAKKRRRPVAV